jgi:tetratricopeptide (TPR) repeat protein
VLYFLYDIIPSYRLCSHALACPNLIEQHQMVFPEAARLLDRAAASLQDHVRYRQAEAFFRRALALLEKALGLDHPSFGITCDNLAQLYRAGDRYAEAEPLFQRALAI